MLRQFRGISHEFENNSTFRPIEYTTRALSNHRSAALNPCSFLGIGHGVSPPHVFVLCATPNFRGRMVKREHLTAIGTNVLVAKGCHQLMHEEMRNLNCERIECDEIWSYVRKMQNQLKPSESIRVGDFWTFVAIDPQTKLVPSYLTGKRTLENAPMFMRDLERRVDNRVQISTDGPPSYIRAVEDAFGANVDYGQVVKFCAAEPTGPGRYAPPKVSKVEKEAIWGTPTWRPLARPSWSDRTITCACPSAGLPA